MSTVHRSLLVPLLVGVCVLFGPAGCGGPEKAEVSGTISLRGQAPKFTGIQVVFQHPDGVQVGAPVAEDGTYRAAGVPSGEVKVKKLTVATDIGTQVHPDNVRAQVEGAAMWGCSLAMFEKATLKDGGLEQTNFDSYTPMRMSQAPEVEVHVIANGEPAHGVGEPAVTVVAPAIGNAIFNACGARVRSLPITAAAVKAGMKA